METFTKNTIIGFIANIIAAIIFVILPITDIIKTSIPEIKPFLEYQFQLSIICLLLLLEAIMIYILHKYQKTSIALTPVILKGSRRIESEGSFKYNDLKWAVNFQQYQRPHRPSDIAIEEPYFPKSILCSDGKIKPYLKERIIGIV